MAENTEEKLAVDTTEFPETIGGPETNMANQVNGVQQPVENKPVDTQKKQEPIYLMGQKFESHDELNKYVSSLASKAQMADQIQQQFNPQPIVTQKKLSDLMFEDPEAYTQELRKSAKEEAKRELLEEQARNDYISRFYKQYPDLVGHEEYVAVVAQKLQKELANLPQSEQESKLANTVRAKFASIRGEKGTTVELGSRQATVAGASSGAPVQTTSQQPVAQDFASQLAAMKAARKKK